MSAARIGTLFTVFLAGGVLTAYLNRGHVEQQTIFWAHYIPMAQHFMGVAERELLTYPLWGYPLLLLLLRDHAVVVGLQVLLATAVMTVLFLRLRNELPGSAALTMLFVVAIPWYTLHSVKWPQSYAASLIILGLLLLDRTCRASSVLTAIAAGLAFGLALHFRSEFLYFPVLIAGLALLLRGSRKFPVLPLRLTLMCAVTALLVLLPWGVHFYRHTGRVSLTASNGGMVAFVSLGQLPGNPWGARFEDEYAYEHLKSRGIKASALSSEGNRILSGEFVKRVKAHPVAFAAKVSWNGVLTLLSGFYNGEIPLSPAEREQFQQLRGRIKTALLRRGETRAEGALGPRVNGAFAHWIALKAAGVLFVLVSIAGLSASLYRGIASPLLFLLGAYITYQFALLLGLSTEPRHLNGLFLALAPFFVVAVRDVRVVLARWRGRAIQHRLAAGDLHLGRSKQPVTNS